MGHLWPLPSSLSRLYKPYPWVMPLRFRPQRPQPHTRSMCCLPSISRFSRFSPWAETQLARISAALSTSPSLQHSHSRCWDLPRFFLVIRHPFWHQLRNGLTFCKQFGMSYLFCTDSQLSLPSPHHSVPLCIFLFHAFILRKPLPRSRIRLLITFLALQVCALWFCISYL